MSPSTWLSILALIIVINNCNIINNALYKKSTLNIYWKD